MVNFQLYFNYSNYKFSSVIHNQFMYYNSSYCVMVNMLGVTLQGFWVWFFLWFKKKLQATGKPIIKWIIYFSFIFTLFMIFSITQLFLTYTLRLKSSLDTWHLYIFSDIFYTLHNITRQNIDIDIIDNFLKFSENLWARKLHYITKTRLT